MTQPQGITIEYKNNFLGTFISTLVAVLVAVPVAMFVSYTVLKANNASASTYQQTATASPVNTVGYPVATTTAGAVSGACAVTAPSDSGGSGTGSGMSYLPGGGIPHYVINNTSSITQNQSETNNTSITTITDSYNDNSTNDSYNTDVDVDVDVDIEDSFQDNDTRVVDSYNDSSVDVNIEDSFTVEDSFQDNSVNQTAIGLLAGNINNQED